VIGGAETQKLGSVELQPRINAKNANLLFSKPFILWFGDFWSGNFQGRNRRLDSRRFALIRG